MKLTINGDVNGPVLLSCLTFPQMNRWLVKQVHYTLAFLQGSALNLLLSLREQTSLISPQWIRGWEKCEVKRWIDPKL
nr:MAG: hypothetical protein EDM05_03460 [Leptolyngbya sp. IPPAS B-1204]